MATKIFKYVLSETVTKVDMPPAARVLCVQVQYGIPCVWAIVNEDEPKVLRWFVIYGTGQPIEGDDAKYVGTFQEHGGALVWHVFERGA